MSEPFLSGSTAESTQTSFSVSKISATVESDVHAPNLFSKFSLHGTMFESTPGLVPAELRVLWS